MPEKEASNCMSNARERKLAHNMDSVVKVLKMPVVSSVSEFRLTSLQQNNARTILNVTAVYLQVRQARERRKHSFGKSSDDISMQRASS